MTRPTTEGWYWYKFGRKPWSIVCIQDLNGRLGVWCPDGPFYWLDDEENGWIEFVTAWDGPIEPPDAG